MLVCGQLADVTLFQEGMGRGQYTDRGWRRRHGELESVLTCRSSFFLLGSPTEKTLKHQEAASKGTTRVSCRQMRQ